MTDVRNIDAQVAFIKDDGGPIATFLPTATSVAATATTLAEALYTQKDGKVSFRGRREQPNGLVVNNPPYPPVVNINGAAAGSEVLNIAKALSYSAVNVTPATFFSSSMTIADDATVTGAVVQLSGAAWDNTQDALTAGSLGSNVSCTISSDGGTVTFHPTSGTTMTGANLLTSLKALKFGTAQTTPSKAVVATLTVTNVDGNGAALNSAGRTVTINLS